MKKTTMCMLLAALSVPAASAFLRAAPAGGGRALVLDASEERKTYDCRGGTAVVNGGENVLSFRNCSEIVVNGGENVIDAGVVEAVAVHGAGNKVTWTETADGRRPRISNEGEGNVIASKPVPGGTGKAPPAPDRAENRKDSDGTPPPAAGGKKPSAKAGGDGREGARKRDRAVAGTLGTGASGDPPGSCAAIAGRWAVSGTCGPDVCVISQRGCAVDLRCRGGSVSYEGSVSGGAVEFAGESGAGIPATCRATITGATMRGTCTPRALPDLPTCGFTANAKK